MENWEHTKNNENKLPYQVEEIFQDGEKLSSQDIGILHYNDDLEHGKAAATLENISESISEKSKRSFRIKWKGISRVPRGAKVADKTINIIQDGSVYDTQSKVIGTYNRIKDSEGKEGENEIVVHILSSPL